MSNQTQKVLLSIAVLFLGVGIGLLGYFFFNQFINPESQLALIANASPSPSKSPSKSPTPSPKPQCGSSSRDYPPSATSQQFSLANLCSPSGLRTTGDYPAFPPKGESISWQCISGSGLSAQYSPQCEAFHAPDATCGPRGTDNPGDFSFDYNSGGTLCGPESSASDVTKSYDSINRAIEHTWKCFSTYERTNNIDCYGWEPAKGI